MDRQPKRWTNFILPLAFIAGLVLLLTLDAGSARVVGSGPIQDMLDAFIGYLASGTELVAGLVIGVGVMRALIEYLSHYVHPRRKEAAFITATRLKLGRTLILGLDLTVASDILRTVVAPTRADIISLGAIVMLRSLLNFVLEGEIEREEAHRSDSSEEE